MKRTITALFPFTDPQDGLEAGNILYLNDILRVLLLYFHSIFAVHELGGSWRESWCHHGPPAPEPPHRSRSVFWLRDLLPKEFPHCAIYSCGHYASSSDLSHSRCWELAYDISNHLKRTPLQERAPIVFIANSTGGIILERVH
jgi:hypothetical protein